MKNKHEKLIGGTPFFWGLALRNVASRPRCNILLCAGSAVCATILVGALLAGSSLRGSLREHHTQRLGEVGWVISVTGGQIRASIADTLTAYLAVKAAPVQILTGTASVAGTDSGAVSVNIIGVDERFWELGPRAVAPQNISASFRDNTSDISAVVNTALARKLGIDAGGGVTLQFQTAIPFALDAPLSPQNDLITLRLPVESVADGGRFGNFSLKTEHVIAYNVFVPLKLLQSVNNTPGMAGAVLIDKVAFGLPNNIPALSINKLDNMPDVLSNKQPALSTNKSANTAVKQSYHIMYDDIIGVVQKSLSISDAGLDMRGVESGINVQNNANAERSAMDTIDNDTNINNNANATDSTAPAGLIGETEAAMTSSLTSSICGIQLTDTRAAADDAVSRGTGFAPPFFGLSFFAFAAPLLLIWLLSTLQVKSRTEEHKILTAAGYLRKHILRVYMSEGLLVFSIGTFAGILLSPLYALALIAALKSVRNAAVMMPALNLHIEILPVLIGGAAAFVCAIASMFIPVFLATRRRVSAPYRIPKRVASERPFDTRRFILRNVMRDKRRALCEIMIIACALFILGTAQLFYQDAVESTYLLIFSIAGVAWLMFGCAGMGIVVARDIEERRGELAMLMAQGFNFSMIRRVLFSEHAAVALAGTLLGLLPAVVASGAMFNLAGFVKIICLFAVVLFCGAGSIRLGLRGLKKQKLLAVLKDEL
jgi:ABC-type antimicrobial peptide transport system permease subunit